MNLQFVQYAFNYKRKLTPVHWLHEKGNNTSGSDYALYVLAETPLTELLIQSAPDEHW